MNENLFVLLLCLAGMTAGGILTALFRVWQWIRNRNF